MHLPDVFHVLNDACCEEFLHPPDHVPNVVVVQERLKEERVNNNGDNDSGLCLSRDHFKWLG